MPDLAALGEWHRQSRRPSRSPGALGRAAPLKSRDRPVATTGPGCAGFWSVALLDKESRVKHRLAARARTNEREMGGVRGSDHTHESR
jgi:hypothetical protein